MFTFTVRPDGGEPYALTATTRDILQWEKTSKGKTLKTLQEQAPIEDFYKIAHFAAKRQQLFTGSLSEFEDSVDIDVEEDEEENPTSQDR